MAIVVGDADLFLDAFVSEPGGEVIPEKCRREVANRIADRGEVADDVSAEPRPELVVAIAKIAEILKSREGRIVVRGHTDGRAYRGGNYDNWRLSAARAQMSYHMLVRGGIDPEKFIGIEGRADRDLKVPEDKGAAQNRRIEILIKAPKP